MIHIELGPSTIVGLGLIVVGLLLYALRIREPNVSRDYDFLFSSIGLLCGGILIFQGWRLDPILLLSQILLSGTAIFFIAESLYLRNNGINPNLFFYKKREIRRNTYYRKLKLKKSLPHYKGWERINYTISISYRN
jgi:hypothetical protein|uniref:Ycf66 n=10 Tax=Sphagnum TaxID=13804 RepID=A0A172N490_9BRYO|nr:hypothetical chloroplast RF66 [Sphagnum multifibrosum]AND47032.1 hypothetical protein RF66 [Sphagnum magellanicum]AND47198.1 hypothetical protein RF66 [Sphagnum angustifolium]AND47693.1 hypothetical protein RF66 [Sphagnum riparium]AND48929.1 hypothetical protein RF66 [Sphagnum fallax]AND49261.1 hypothetical protein RF66 [Sphagnum recurvum]AND49344.1 hypothetical protein RF66 [Sphagnum balticum]AND49510.1 hypothetical protein RF66 [Sphagnum majus]AND49593.1 hypothetical protein RF66 [Spha